MKKQDVQLCGYCGFVSSAPKDSPHHRYHDLFYGYPLEDDRELFGRLVLEINQAGLSWTTILKKEANFRNAYFDWDIARIAAVDEKDRSALLQDSGIIRNRLKIEAAVHNATVVLSIQKQHGSFYEWLLKHQTFEKPEWVSLFRKTFRFTGGEIVNEFLMSVGFLPGAHDARCQVYDRILLKNPIWARQKP